MTSFHFAVYMLGTCYQIKFIFSMPFHKRLKNGIRLLCAVEKMKNSMTDVPVSKGHDEKIFVQDEFTS